MFSSVRCLSHPARALSGLWAYLYLACVDCLKVSQVSATCKLQRHPTFSSNKPLQEFIVETDVSFDVVAPARRK